MSLSTIRAKLVALLAEVDAEIASQGVQPPAPAAPEALPPLGPVDLKKFFDHLRSSKILGTKLTADQVKGCEAIIAACRGMPVSWTAYVLATAHHETGRKMVPNTEDLNYTTAARIRAVWPTRFATNADAQPFVRKPRELANEVYNGRMQNRPGSDDGWHFRGRSWPHITGRENYTKADQKLGLNGELLRNPDLALRWDIAAGLTAGGMEEGWFTGKGLGNYLPNGRATAGQFVSARKIINGTDQAESIAAYALVYQSALVAGGYPT